MADFKEENADYIEVGKKEVQKTKEIENSAETAVKNLEKDQTQANLDLATSKVDAVTDADKKEKFQKRIATVKTAIEAKKEKEHQKRFEENRERMQNKQTLNRMKKNEKYSYRYNSAKGKSWSSRNHDNATSKANKKRSKALEKRQDEAREKYENNDYQPGERKTTKKGKIREFYNPFKRDY